MLDQEPHLALEVRRIDEVVVVRGDDDRDGESRELVDEHRQGLVLHAHPRRGQKLQRGEAEAGLDRPGGGDEVGPEAASLAVPGVEGEPGEGPPIRHCPGR
jgi:hypothetical protein